MKECFDEGYNYPCKVTDDKGDDLDEKKLYKNSQKRV